jgi:phosphatidyl-myo-inositol alpha-mannosyltransferase
MNIGFISPYDYAYPGGVNTHISNLAMTLAKMGHQVRILAPCSSKKSLPPNEDIIPLGKTIPYPSNGSVARLTISWWLMPKIRRILEEDHFDILHFHEPLFPSLPWMVLPLSHSLNVATFHAYYRRSFGYTFWKPLLKRFYNRLDGKIAVSEPARKFVSRYFPGEYRVIPHGIDLHHFGADVDPIPEFRDGRLNFLFVSRLEGRKGVKYLLEAYRMAKKECPASRLILVGPGERSRREYARWVRAVKLEDVVFTGRVSFADLPNYYHTADVFCIPAVGQESFGLVLLEAMAAGKPILATNIEGYASVVSDKVDGLLVKPRDSRALADAMIALANDKSLREEMGFKGKQKANAHSWQAITQRTFDYYTELMKGKVAG